MKHEKTKIREALKATDHPPALRSVGDFWADFKSRAAHVPQDGVRVLPSPRVFTQARIRVAAAAAVLAVSGIVALQFLDHPENAGKVSAVQAVDVFTDYSSLLILEDTDHGGTFVWINEDDSADHG